MSYSLVSMVALFVTILINFDILSGRITAEKGGKPSSPTAFSFGLPRRSSFSICFGDC